MNTSTRYLLLLLLIAVFVASLFLYSKYIPQLESETAELTDTLEGYRAESYALASGWGYRVYSSGKLIIDQPHIPALPGNKTFNSSEQAEQAAKLIVLKLQSGVFPPTITLKELDSLSIEY
jgi:hypothetical protein